jgi:hypothetical protein
MPENAHKGLWVVSGPRGRRNRIGDAANPTAAELDVSTLGSADYDPVSPDYISALDASSPDYAGYGAEVAQALTTSGLTNVLPVSTSNDPQTICNNIISRDQQIFYLANLAQQMQQNANLAPDPDVDAVITSYNARQNDMKTNGCNSWSAEALNDVSNWWNSVITTFSDATGAAISGNMRRNRMRGRPKVGLFVIDDVIVICIVTAVVAAAYEVQKWHDDDLQSQQDQLKINAVIAKINANPQSTSADMVNALNGLQVVQPGAGGPGSVITSTISSIENLLLIAGVAYVGFVYVLPMFKKKS